MSRSTCLNTMARVTWIGRSVLFSVKFVRLFSFVYTQKELDPDFVAFNSQNRRYHFPARFYIPARGVFGQADPLLTHNWLLQLHAFGKRSDYARELSMPVSRPGLHTYAYVGARATIKTDPSGLKCPGPFTEVETYHFPFPDISQILLIASPGIIKGMEQWAATAFKNYKATEVCLTKGGFCPIGSAQVLSSICAAVPDPQWAFDHGYESATVITCGVLGVITCKEPPQVNDRPTTPGSPPNPPSGAPDGIDVLIRLLEALGLGLGVKPPAGKPKIPNPPTVTSPPVPSTPKVPVPTGGWVPWWMIEKELRYLAPWAFEDDECPQGPSPFI